jgi:nucleoside phosphorylase
MHDPLPTRFQAHTMPALAPKARPPAKLPPLPAVDWSTIGAKPPVVRRDRWDSDSALPKVDAVILTWTVAEGAALSHVFGGGDDPTPHESGAEPWKRNGPKSPAWQDHWQYYRHDFTEVEHSLPKGAPSLTAKAWGYGCLVDLPGSGKITLLLKSDMHLSTDKSTDPLEFLVKQLIDECKPDLLLTIGTAGGTKLTDTLGSVVVANTAKFDLAGELATREFNHKSFGNDWTPDAASLASINPLLLEIPATRPALKELAQQVKGCEKPEDCTLDAFENAALDGRSPKLVVTSDPVLTDNGYDIADTGGKFADYACLEMDDAIIAMACNGKNQPFGILRNISDPIMNAGLPEAVQKSWSYLVYSTYGIYTSFNGALSAWASVSGMK